ncbi:MAG: hypothetical protein AAB358_04010 [Patescibacteria group bacterium]
MSDDAKNEKKIETISATPVVTAEPKSFGFWLGVAVCAILAIWFSGLLGFWQSAAFVLFVGTLSFVAIALEPESALKRYIRKYGKVALTVAIAVVIAIAVNSILAMPASQFSKWLRHGGESGVDYSKLFAFEALLIGLAGGFGYLAVYGGKKDGAGKTICNGWRRVLAFMAIMAIVVVAWQMQTPKQYLLRYLYGCPIGRYILAQYQRVTGGADLAANDQIAFNNLQWGVAKSQVNLYSVMDDELEKVGELPTGEIVQRLSKEPPSMGSPLPIVWIIMKGKDGDYIGGNEALVNLTLFNWSKSKPEPIVAMKPAEPAKPEATKPAAELPDEPLAKPKPVVKVLSKTEAIVPIVPGQPIEAGVMAKAGDIIRYSQVTAPFKVMNASHNGFHLVKSDMTFVANDEQQIVLVGHSGEGSVHVKVIPQG